MYVRVPCYRFYLKHHFINILCEMTGNGSLLVIRMHSIENTQCHLSRINLFSKSKLSIFFC